MALTVADLLAAGRLERIAPDRSAALVRIAKAEQHLATARTLLGHDNEMAYAGPGRLPTRAGIRPTSRAEPGRLPTRGGIRPSLPPAELTTTLQPASGRDIGGTVFSLTHLAGSE